MRKSPEQELVMFNYSYLVELLTPKRAADDQIEGLLDRFAERYRRIMDAGCGISIPDNPMGQPRLGALESIELRDLSVDPKKIVTGAAFNPYNPMPLELNRMQQKIDAGAKYVVTQPIIGKDDNVDRLKELNIAVVVEAWMSNNIDLLYKSVGKKRDEKAEKYDPLENLKALHAYYPECSVYLSMLSFKQVWQEILPRLSS